MPTMKAQGSVRPGHDNQLLRDVHRTGIIHRPARHREPQTPPPSQIADAARGTVPEKDPNRDAFAARRNSFANVSLKIFGVRRLVAAFVWRLNKPRIYADEHR